MSARVVVAMSGGVDSSVAAAILREQGYDVVGIAMRLASQEHGAKGRQVCCSYDDFEDARRVAERMDFPFYVVDLRAEFEARVIDNFVDEYLAGRTPNPCVMCNREIKFARLWRRAQALGAEFVATGHYARINRDSGGRFHLRRALDPAKDQSYFLFAMTQTELARTLFPLGEMTKAEVRARARSLGLANADKPESQEICFVPDRDYADLVARRADPSKVKTGRIIDGGGRVLAEHNGIHRFTVGQRRGLGVSAGEPLYVREIDPVRGHVTVGSREELTAAGLRADRVSLVDERLAAGGDREIQVKIRYRHPAIAANLKLLARDRAEVRFVTNGYPAVTPGQACVFYDHDEVLGGGFIQHALKE
ncbi:MAG TPA: tRNA 2-thiouridine(34) synthase MnmA [Candidatus Binataceae bacterium]|nr:tRNA 2-thiouridine(34) synthase MnmA [Candidatus Binataceae bacterium]